MNWILWTVVSFRRHFLSLALLLTILGQAHLALANAGGIHIAPTGSSGNASVPDASDPNANLPSLPSVEEAPVVDSSAPATKIDAQSCDPTLDIKFYRSLENYYCLQSPSGECPKGFSKVLSFMARYSPPLLIGTAASAGVGFANAALEALLSTAGTKAISVKNANEQLKMSVSPELMQSPKYLELREQLEKAPSPKEFRKLLMQLRSAVKTNAEAIAEIDRAAAYVPNKWSKAAFIGVVGVGVAASVANEMNVFAMTMGDKQGSCQNVSGNEWTAHDPANQCRPQYAVNGNVVKFLDLPHDKKMEILNSDPAVCQYYKDFNEHLKNWLKPTQTLSNITCSANRISYQIGEAEKRVEISLAVGNDGAISKMQASRLPVQPQSSTWLDHFSVDFADHAGERVIDKISFPSLPSLSKTSSEAQPINLTYDQLLDDSNPSTMSENYTPVILASLTNHKLYSDMVQACCNATDDSVQGKCKAALEKPDAKSLRLLQQQSLPANSSGAPVAK